MTWHDISQLTTLPHLTSPHNQPQYFIAPCNQPHQNRSPQHHHGTAEGSFTQKTRSGHRSGWSPCAHSIGKFFLWLIVFFFETSAPGLPGSTCTYDYLLPCGSRGWWTIVVFKGDWEDGFRVWVFFWSTSDEKLSSNPHKRVRLINSCKTKCLRYSIVDATRSLFWALLLLSLGNWNDHRGGADEPN